MRKSLVVHENIPRQGGWGNGTTADTGGGAYMERKLGTKKVSSPRVQNQMFLYDLETLAFLARHSLCSFVSHSEQI